MNVKVFFKDSFGGVSVKENGYAKLYKIAIIKHSVMKRVLLVIRVMSGEGEFKIMIDAKVSIKKRSTT